MRYDLKGQRGQALLEFAVVLPVLIMLLVGIVQMGLLMHSYLTVQEAAREGARSAAVGTANADVEIKVKNVTTAAGINAANVSVNIAPENARAVGTAVTVTVTVPNPMTSAIPFVSVVFPNKLTGTMVMRMEAAVN